MSIKIVANLAWTGNAEMDVRRIQLQTKRHLWTDCSVCH